MESKIEKLSRFASRYFNVEERRLYSNNTDNQSSLARYIVWYYLHRECEVPAGVLSKEYFRQRRAIFRGISKFDWMIKNQKMYKDMYDKFVEEYKKATP